MRVNTYATVDGLYLDKIDVEFDYSEGRAQTHDSPEEDAELVITRVSSWPLEMIDISPIMTKDEREELEQRLLEDTLKGEYSD
jgi:hypothetical protein